MWCVLYAQWNSQSYWQTRKWFTWKWVEQLYHSSTNNGIFLSFVLNFLRFGFALDWLSHICHPMAIKFNRKLATQFFFLAYIQLFGSGWNYFDCFSLFAFIGAFIHIHAHTHKHRNTSSVSREKESIYIFH